MTASTLMPGASMAHHAEHTDNRLAKFSLIYYFIFFLVFIGDAKIWIGESSVDIPLACFGMLFIFLIRSINKNIVFSRETALFLGIFLLGLASSLMYDSGKLTRIVAAMIPLVVCILALTSLPGIPLDIRLIRRAIAVGGIILSIWVYIGYIRSLGIDSDYYDRKLLIETLLGRSNYLAAFLFFLTAIFFKKNKILAMFFLGAVFATMSRGGILMALLFIGYQFFLGGDYRLSRWVAVLMALLGVCAYLIWHGDFHLEQMLASAADSGNEYASVESTRTRLYLWDFSLKLLQDSPLFGIGPNGFRTAVEAAVDMEDVWGPHNAILLLWLNYGVLGVLLYLKYLHAVYCELAKAARVDVTFGSIKIAFVFLLVYSLFEPLVGSASFELLVVLLFITAKNLNRQHALHCMHGQG